MRTRAVAAGAAAPGGGFEPPLTGPKPAVLPLDDPGRQSAPTLTSAGSEPHADTVDKLRNRRLRLRNLKGSTCDS